MPQGSRRTGKVILAIAWHLLAALGIGNAMVVQAEDQTPAFTEIAQGIYLRIGKHEEMGVGNHGDIANSGFVIGTESVAVIDAGGSPQAGKDMRAAIRALTNLAVSHLILTHSHPDHFFGSSAFADAEHVVAHQNFPRALIQRGSFYRNRYDALFENSDTPVSLKPTLLVADELHIKLGGRSLLVRAHRTAHTDNDLSVFDSLTQTLWASDLIFSQRIPSLDGSIVGWLGVMQDLAALNARLVIPGHGLPGPWSVVTPPQHRYLTLLLGETRQFIAENRRLSDALNLIGLSEKENWQLFDSYHRGNITKAYTELEWE
ncbi:MAG: quinoprotein relay system zinc metallohydrolase 2 [Gammaproteobacteria bacterium]|nr:quinoprotein relay system zinc metallohydrolase 2 [Gammaproteobacteria bacterium]